MADNDDPEGELDRLERLVGTSVQSWVSDLVRSIRGARFGLVAGGSAISTAVQCAALPAAGPWPILSLIGIAAAVFVLIGAIIVGRTERDPVRELGLADAAIRRARAVEAEARKDGEEFDALFDLLDRSTELYAAMMQMRGALERLPHAPVQTDEYKIEKLLEVAERSLLVAFGFQTGHTYTICVFRAEDENDKTILRCVGHRRALPCAISKARAWPEGVGAAGMAFAAGRELIFPDMTSPAFSTIREAKPDAVAGEADPYVSIVSVPIHVGPQNVRWGVVVATSDQPNHFSLEQEAGVRTSEAARALAGMVALALTEQHMSAPPAAAPVNEVTVVTSDGDALKGRV